MPRPMDLAGEVFLTDTYISDYKGFMRLSVIPDDVVDAWLSRVAYPESSRGVMNKLAICVSECPWTETDTSRTGFGDGGVNIWKGTTRTSIWLYKHDWNWWLCSFDGNLHSLKDRMY